MQGVKCQGKVTNLYLLYAVILYVYALIFVYFQKIYNPKKIHIHSDLCKFVFLNLIETQNYISRSCRHSDGMSKDNLHVGDQSKQFVFFFWLNKTY